MSAKGYDADNFEVAKRSVMYANTFLSQWRGLAKTLSRDSRLGVKLAASGQPSTDGKDIFIPIPVLVEDPPSHEKNLCGKRNSITSIQECPGCRFREQTLIYVVHEISHIVHDSFSPVKDEHAAKAAANLIALYCDDDNSKMAQRIRKGVGEAIDSGYIDDYWKLSALLGPYFKMLLNAIEDMRVNRETMRIRAGTKVMFRALYNDTFLNGSEQPDGSVMHWRDAPVDAQIIIGVMCLVMEIDPTEYLADKVVEDLGDSELRGMCAAVTQEQSVTGMYDWVFPLYKRLMDLGYFKVDVDEEQEEESSGSDGMNQGGEGDQSESGEKSEGGGEKGDDSGDFSDDSSDSNGGGGSDPSDEQDDDGGGSSDDSQDASDPDEVQEWVDQFGQHPDKDHSDEGEDGKPEEGDGDGDGDEANDQAGKSMKGVLKPGQLEDIKQAMEIVLVQMEHFDNFTREITGLNLVKDGATDGLTDRDQPIIEIDERILAPALGHLRALFTKNKAHKRERNKKKGHIVTKTLGQRAPIGDDRIFGKRTIPGRKDYFVVIGLDASGSTCARIGDGRQRIDLIKEAAMAKAELLARLGIDFAIYAHSGNVDYGSGRYTMSVEIVEIKSRTQRWGREAKQRLSNVKHFSANLDGHTLEFYRKRAAESDATDKIILYYTDGAMPAENYNEELEILQSEIKTCRRLGIDLVGIGVNTSAPEDHGLETIRLDDISDVPDVVKALRRKLAS